ncbi:MAG TPA: hypothetical protein VFH05_12115, partial [Nitrospira sp.]|nr:hypothetical protein [Nitrospira sp.]
MKTSRRIIRGFRNPGRLLPLRLLLFISLAAGSSPAGLWAAEVGQANDASPQTTAPDSQADAAPVEVDPSITLKGAVWRTKAGIVFLKTPVGLLTLSSKTTLKDLKASHEVSFWVHDRHSAVEIRKRSDGSLV